MISLIEKKSTGGVVFIFSLIFFIGLGLWFFYQGASTQFLVSNGVECTGIVEDVFSQKYRRSIYYSFLYSGKEIHGDTSEFFINSIQKGQEVSIYYDISSGRSCIKELSGINKVVFFSFSLICFFASIIGILRNRNTIMKKNDTTGGAAPAP